VFLVSHASVAILFCLVTMLGWGSWANTQKLAGKEKWPFELYYWDYGFGVLLMALAFAATLGSLGHTGMSVATNLSQAGFTPSITAITSGAIFNCSNILLVVAIDAAGMSVAFPVGVGLALVIGTVGSYLQAPKGNALLLFAGVALILFAMGMSAAAHGKLPRAAGRGGPKGFVFAGIAGCLMGFFYPQLMKSISPDFNSGRIQPGYLTPYAALLLFGVGLVLSNFAANTIFMRTGGLKAAEYFRGSAKLHALGLAGGAIWMLALGLNVIASGAAGPAISYALGQGATLVAAIWGVAIWKEFRHAPPAVTPYLAMMFAGYSLGLTLIGAATF
jgi:glucose uptake protein